MKPLSHIISGPHRSNYDKQTDRVFSHVCDHGRPANSQVRSQQSELAGKGPEPNGNQKHRSGWHTRSPDSLTNTLFAAHTRSALGLQAEAVDNRSRRSLVRYPARCTALQQERTGDLKSNLKKKTKKQLSHPWQKSRKPQARLNYARFRLHDMFVCYDLSLCQIMRLWLLNSCRGVA